MLRLFCNKIYLSLLKAHKPRAEIALSLQQVNGLRTLLKMEVSEKSDFVQNSLDYVRDRIKSNSKIQSKTELLRVWDQIRPAESEANILSYCSELGGLEVEYVDTVIQFWGQLFLKYIEQSGKSINSDLGYAVKDYYKILNYLIYLMTPSQRNLFIYLRFYSHSKDLNLSKQKNHSQLRFIIDRVLELPSLSDSNRNFFITFTTNFSMHYYYYTRQKQISQFVYSKISDNWYTSRDVKYVLAILNSITRNPDPPRFLVQSVHKLLPHRIWSIKLKAFSFMLELFMIDKNNIHEAQFMVPLKEMIKEGAFQMFSLISRLFYYAQIWIPEFWIPYFDFMSKNDNYLKVYKLNHYIIDDLLANCGEGGEKLKQQALKFRKLMHSRGFDITNLNIRDEYEKEYGKMVQSKSSIQLHVANSLRLICMVEVLTEIALKYFLVDILVDKKIVIELNNATHYKLINGQSRLNLKSNFRERVLTKAGYVCKNIPIQDFTESNFLMLEEINKIVEETQELKAKTKNGVNN